MIRLLLFLLIVGALVGGYLYVKKNGAASFLAMTQKATGGKVLGSSNVQGAVSVVQPALQGFAGSVSNTVSQAADKVLVQNQKVEIDQAIQSVQASAAGIPQAVFNEARYAYCKQVVIDHDGQH